MNNYNYFNDDWYKNIPTTSSLRNMNYTNPSLVNPTEGYNRGNMFANLYDQYKNYSKPIMLQISPKIQNFYILGRGCQNSKINVLSLLA